MVKKLTMILAAAVLMSSIAPQAKADSITKSVNEILVIDPVLVNGEPDPTAMVVCGPSELAFVTPTYHIGITWQALQMISFFAFGNPNAEIFAWDDSMTLIGCSWDTVCHGGVKFDDSGVIGNGTLYSTPHLGIMTIDSLTITTPEPNSVELLGIGLVLFVGLFQRKIRTTTVR